MRKIRYKNAVMLSGYLLVGAGTVAPAERISVSVRDADLPVGGSTVVQVLLDPSAGPVAAMGGAVSYDPDALSVEFVGTGPSSLGGPAQAVHLVHRAPGRILFGGALPAGVSHTPLAAEPFLELHLKRLLSETTQVILEDPFYQPAGSAVFQSVPTSSIVFGITSGDSDGDGILDAWEFLHFGSLAIATAASDYDKDGVSDVDEARLGTPPRIPYLTGVPVFDGVGGAGIYRVALTVPTEANVRYRVERTDALVGPTWEGTLMALVPGGAAVHDVLVGSGSDHTIEVPVWGAGPHFFRIVVAGQ